MMIPSNNIIAENNNNAIVSYLYYIEPYGSETTSLTINNDIFLILNGEHIRDLKAALNKSLFDAVKTYIKINNNNKHSDSDAVFGEREDLLNLTPRFKKFFTDEEYKELLEDYKKQKAAE